MDLGKIKIYPWHNTSILKINMATTRLITRFLFLFGTYMHNKYCMLCWYLSYFNNSLINFIWISYFLIRPYIFTSQLYVQSEQHRNYRHWHNIIFKFYNRQKFIWYEMHSTTKILHPTHEYHFSENMGWLQAQISKGNIT